MEGPEQGTEPATSEPHRRRAQRRRDLLAGAALGFCLGAFAIGAGLRAQPAEAGTTLERKAFDEAVDLVLDQYVDPVDANALLARGLRHMVAGLDSHSVYLDAEARARLAAARRSGRVVGIHLVDPLPGQEGWRIDSIVPGSPADVAGLHEGETILKIADQDASSFVHALEAMLALRAPGSKDIPLVVRDIHGMRRSVDIASQVQPKAYAVESRLWRPQDDESGSHAKIGVITIHVFAPGVGEQVRRDLHELHRAAGGQLEGLVLDLRGNPGGEVDEALIIAELFIADGILTRTRGRGGKILREERAHRRGSDEALPLALLQDASSASASELLARRLAVPRAGHRLRHAQLRQGDGAEPSRARGRLAASADGGPLLRRARPSHRRRGGAARRPPGGHADASARPRDPASLRARAACTGQVGARPGLARIAQCAAAGQLAPPVMLCFLGRDISYM